MIEETTPIKRTTIGLINNEDGQPHVYIAYESTEDTPTTPLIAFTPEQAIETATILIAYARQILPPIVYGATKPLFQPQEPTPPDAPNDPDPDPPKEAA